ncbi:peptidoglycan-binding protein [Streptantibioticus rubrisoli]|uniref:Peptidoglycan-binding protein n=1 Tax=Streptantibioticus rubrisoli TaxID=1387313 RepID=A0ABT1PF26_9ACTN|nr:peptidoglycan-binding protein [Streptantibioticus rubrisoli]MCQ4043967.1 peptidoglycan-binding protein [Streptantibioticus rubrisoli]
MNGKTLATRIGLVGAAIGLAVGAFAGTANATTVAGYVGSGQTNNSHAVWCVQKLIDDSPAPYTTPTDGVFGPDTENAIESFQVWAHIRRDGIVGPQTGDALLTKFHDYYDNYCYGYLPTTW